MMTKYIAFLRAINVGGRRVKMDRLRHLFGLLGLANVESFIASGNVIFDAPSGEAHALEAKIAAHLEQRLGYEVAVFIRSVSELIEIASYKPFIDSEQSTTGNTLYVAFSSTSMTPESWERLRVYQNDIDDFHAQGREIFWLCRKERGASNFSGSLLEKAIGRAATIRNARTVSRLAEKYAGDGA